MPGTSIRSYYQQFEAQQNQILIDQKIKEHLGQAAYQQVGASYNHLRPRLPVLPTPMMPMPGNMQLPMNSPLLPGARPPVLPRPLPGTIFDNKYVLDSVICLGPTRLCAGPRHAANDAATWCSSFSWSSQWSPKTSNNDCPDRSTRAAVTPTASGASSMVTPVTYQPNSTAPTSGGFGSFNMSAQAPEANNYHDQDW
ncbi:C2H2 and C2HC zinc fingers superfamily protein [Actinidia rufa]|uniref:C2H2 and C2HC zinc fingers superfamily protein n=1 Tax=Actinidia rufa TaxID=165716 RepID=A0A7J0FJ84_9ERIC|nr:C2H2 and C2HC zinc fingers superfamily protein [Actinidia rufa]